MKINLTKKQIAYLRTALYFATEWELSFVDAHMVGWEKKGNAQVRCVPKELKQVVSISKKNIKAFGELRTFLIDAENIRK